MRLYLVQGLIRPPHCDSDRFRKERVHRRHTPVPDQWRRIKVTNGVHCWSRQEAFTAITQPPAVLQSS